MVETCGAFWYHILWKHPQRAPVVRETFTFPGLTSAQAERVRAGILQRHEQRLAEEKKKWEAANPPLSEEKFLERIRPK